ncbi:MAG: DUF4097 family beta strand repeat protein [Anaerolineales bacterium]|nr:DUF4097 family beta strand repeat protein [Anaerolineales bacterium]
MTQRRIPILLISAGLLVVCGLCALTLYGTYAWFSTQQANIRLFTSIDTSATLTENETYAAKDTLIIDSDSGNITILPGEGDQIEVEMVKTGWGTDQAGAEKAVEAIKVDVQETNNTLQFTYNLPEEFGVGLSRGGQDSVDFTIRAPANTIVEIQGGFGDISLTGLTQRVTVDTGFGLITAQDLQTGENPIHLVTSFGDIQFENSTGSEIYLESSNGKLTGTDLSTLGTLEASSSFGDIHLDGLTAETVTVSSQNGVVEVLNGEVSGKITASSNFGDITLQNLTANSYNLESQNGKISVDGLAGKVVIRNGFGDIEVTHGVNVTLDMGSSNGNVSYSGSLNPDADHQLNSDFGDLTVTLPEDSAFDLSLETSFGEINSDFPVTLFGTLEETSWQAEINGGGPLITATTDNGNITLRILAEGE